MVRYVHTVSGRVAGGVCGAYAGGMRDGKLVITLYADPECRSVLCSLEEGKTRIEALSGVVIEFDHSARTIGGVPQ